MKTANMKVMYNCLDTQLKRLIKSKQKEFGCVITLYLDEANGTWMSVFNYNLKMWDSIQLSYNGNKDKTCTAIMRWSKEHGNEVKGG